MVTTALKMPWWRRDHAQHRVAASLLHHSDTESQYTSIAVAETPVLEGIAASIGGVGDAYDNALAETMLGLFKAEPSAAAAPSCRVRWASSTTSSTPRWNGSTGSTTAGCTASWAASPPEEYENAYYAQT
jgi:transposase InsO family protein